MHLGDDPEREWILNGKSGAGILQIAPGEKFPYVPRRFDLSRERLRPRDFVVEGAQVAGSGLERERGRQVGKSRDPFGLDHREAADPDRGAVCAHHRKPVLRLELVGLDSGPVEGFRARQDLAVDAGPAASDRDVGDHGHVADVGGSDRPVLAHERVHPRVQHPDELLEGPWSRPGAALGKAGDAGEHERADLLVG